MTDSFEDLGTSAVLPYEINWETPPSIQYLQSRTIRHYGFSAQEMVTEVENTPFRGSFSFLLHNKEREYEFTDFWMDKQGRLKKFWVKSPDRFFTLKSNVGAGSATIYTEDNRADFVWQGHERIWIKLANGDEISRWVSTITRNQVEDRLELNLETLILSAFDIEDVVIFGRIFLVRCDMDKFTYNFHTDTVSEVSIRVQEVIQEYDDIG